MSDPKSDRKDGPEGALDEHLEYARAQRLDIELAVRFVSALSGHEVAEMKRLADLVLDKELHIDTDSYYPRPVAISSAARKQYNDGIRVGWTRRLQNILARAAAGQDVTDLLKPGAEVTA